MGTNYYWHSKPPCKTCGRSFEPLHIGKSSHGWNFALHVHPEVPDLYRWIEKFLTPGSEIRDEYGNFISLESMLEKIMKRGTAPNTRDSTDPSFVSPGAGTWDNVQGDFS